MELASPLHTALYLNCLNRTMQINGVYKTFDETFWSDNFVPILYPVWDSDRDRLETFVRMKDGSTHMNKNKYVRNQKTGQYKWVSYQFDHTQMPAAEVDALYEKLEELYTLYREKQEHDLETALAAEFARTNHINMSKLLMVRKFLLMDSDYTVMPDSPISDAEKEQWKVYRQKLRDIPQEQGSVPPDQIVFPITPTKYAAQEDTGEYLTNETEHFYKCGNMMYKKYVDRIVSYISIAVATRQVDDQPVTYIRKPRTGDQSLDNILDMLHNEMVESGDI